MTTQELARKVQQVLHEQQEAFLANPEDSKLLFVTLLDMVEPFVYQEIKQRG